MAMDKQFRRLEAKIDALLKKNGVDPAQFTEQAQAARPSRELSAAEQQAIDNAPKAEASIAPTEQGPRVTNQNAPSIASSVPPADKTDTGKSDSKRK